MDTFEIGDRVCWSGGREDRPIVSRGLFRNYIEGSSMCKVVVYLINNSPTHTIMEVDSSLLKLDSIDE